MQRPLNVMFDHQIVVDQVFGGISRYYASLLPELERYGIRGKFFSPIYHNQYLADMPKKYVSGYHVPASPLARRAAHLAARMAMPIAAKLRRPDIIHETYYSARRLAPSTIPVVLTVHDMIHELYPQQFAHDPAAQNKKAAIARADHIICVSENTSRDLIRMYPDTKDRVTVIHLGFTFEEPYSINQNDRKQYLLYVGPRGGYKNFSGLLDAFAISLALKKDFEILCVGGGSFSKEELERIHAAGCENSIKQVTAHDEELQQLYAGAAAFVYPSLYEGFGIPPLEAMAANCPVVTMRSSSIPEVCGNAAQYAEANDPEALCAAIEAVVSSPVRTAELILLGQDRFPRFSASECAMRTARVYEAVA